MGQQLGERGDRRREPRSEVTHVQGGLKSSKQHSRRVILGITSVLQEGMAVLLAKLRHQLSRTQPPALSDTKAFVHVCAHTRAGAS